MHVSISPWPLRIGRKENLKLMMTVMRMMASYLKCSNPQSCDSHINHHSMYHIGISTLNNLITVSCTHQFCVMKNSVTPTSTITLSAMSVVLYTHWFCIMFE